MEELFQQLFNGLMIGSTYAVVALGFGLVFSVMRVINFAHPEIFVLGEYLAFITTTVIFKVDVRTLSTGGAIGFFLLVLLVAMAVTGFIGLLLERVVIRPLRGTFILIPFIATAGVSVSMQYGVQRFFGPDPLRVPSVIPSGTLNLGGVSMTSMQITTFFVAVVIMVSLSYYVRGTRWGRASRAVAERPNMAAACGINVNRVYQLAIGIASAMAGAAGVTIGMLYTTAAPFGGHIFGTKSFVCMLVAGNRHIEGIMAVGLVLGVMEALVTGYLTTALRDAVAFGVLLAVLFFRPNGFFGSYEESHS